MSDKTAKKTAGPSTLSLVIDAIKESEDRKGASIQGIKAYILQQCPDREPGQLKNLLKKAIMKGLDDGVLMRPPRDAGTGYSLTGRLKINKEKEKEMKPKREAAKVKSTKKLKMPKTPLKQRSPAKVVKKVTKSPAKKATKPVSKPKAPKAKTTAKTTPKKTKGRGKK